MSASGDDALVFGGSVYFYQYDSSTQGYRALSESALGLALMGHDQAYRLFCYNRAQEELFTMPMDIQIKFTPQQDNYVNFYDKKNQNFSMRFKDEAQVSAFLQAVACIKLYICRATNEATKFDDIRAGEGYAVQIGDIVGVRIQAWKLDSFTNGNPMEVAQSPPVLEAMSGDDLHKIKLGDEDTEGVVGISAAIVGMQKGGIRYVYLPVAPSSWALGYVELLKVKKEKRASTPPSIEPPAVQSLQQEEPEAEKREDLVSRMAHLSRMGSSHAGLVLPTTGPPPASRRSSQQELLVDTTPTRIQTPITLAMPSSSTPSTPSPEKKAEPVIVAPHVESLRREQESLLQEQQALARMKKELEEARQTQPLAISKPATPPTSTATSIPPASSPPPPLNQQDVFRSGNLAPYGSFAPPSTPPFTPSAYSRNFGAPSMPYLPLQVQPPPSLPLASAPLTSDMDVTLQKVQRTTLSMEGMLIDMQRKMDRLLTQQSTSSNYSSYAPRRHDVGGSNSLLKNIERALGENESLQEDNSRLSHQVQELQRYNRQLQDDIDRLHAESQRQVDRSSMYNAGEVQSLQLALENAKQRCSQMENDVQRWSSALEKERGMRTQLEQDLASSQRQLNQQSQALQNVQTQTTQEYERKIEEARNVAVLTQKKMAEKKAASASQINQLTQELEHLEEQLNAQSSYKTEMERLQTQLRLERESHNRDADEAKMHLEELVKDMTTSRSKLDAAERAANDLQDQLNRERDRAAKSREGRSALFKELMNDIYFACQDAFDEEVEYTGKEVAIQIRKILKQQTNDLLDKLERQ